MWMRCDRELAVVGEMRESQLCDLSSAGLVAHRVDSFRSDVEKIVLPRKIALSHDRRLLLMFGVMFRGQSCLVVYQLQR